MDVMIARVLILWWVLTCGNLSKKRGSASSLATLLLATSQLLLWSRTLSRAVAFPRSPTWSMQVDAKFDSLKYLFWMNGCRTTLFGSDRYRGGLMQVDDAVSRGI